VVEAHVLKVFCNRLGEATMFAPECLNPEMQAQITGTTVRR
jgi:hypothetical protein